MVPKVMCLLPALFFSFITLTSAIQSCVVENVGNWFFPALICRCTEQFCDSMSPVTKIPLGNYLKYVTSKSGKRFDVTEHSFKIMGGAAEPFTFPRPTINVKKDQIFQKMYGWGSHFTDSAGLDIFSVTDPLRDYIMDALFSEEGIEYSLCRIPIGGSVLSLRTYSLDDTDEPDPHLYNFTLAPEDLKYKIPVIKAALELTQGHLEFIAYPASPPLWMKSPKQWTGLTSLRVEYYGAYADYYIRFLEAYRDYGINIWGITTGNSPSYARIGFLIPINVLGWDVSEQAQWVAEHLGPKLKEHDIFGDTKLLVYDDQLIGFSNNVDKFTERNPQCLEFTDGIAVQTYANILTSSPLFPASLKAVEKPLILVQTSFANGFYSSFGLEPAVALGSWERAATYIDNILTTMDNGFGGWIDLNLVGNMAGGHTWNRMGFDATIIVNVQKNEFYKQPTYYAFGHFSKFVPPGSVRIAAAVELAGFWTGGLHSVGFKRPDDGYVINVYNRGPINQRVNIKDPYRGLIELDIESNSIVSIVYW